LYILNARFLPAIVVKEKTRFFVTFFAAPDAPLTALRLPYAIAVSTTTLFLRQIKHLLL
jgi:hypothetical protein